MTATCLLVGWAFAPSALAAGEFEPNDDRDTAYGPLAGGVNYTATIETDNDVDWYVFYIKQYSQMDFSATGIGSDCLEGWGSIDLRERDGKFVERFDPGGPNETEHLYLTLDPGRYYLEVESYGDNCTGDSYRLRIDPAGAITTSVQCGEAIVARDGVVPALAAVNQDLVENGETLAAKAAAVHVAKKEVRQSSKQVKRLKKKRKRLQQKLERFKKSHKLPGRFRKGRKMQRKLGRTNSKLRRIRSEAREARGEVDEAKAERRPVWQEKLDLQALAGQHQQALAQLDAQIVESC